MDSVLDERFNLFDLLDPGVLKEVCEEYANTFDLGMVILNNDRKELIAICPDKKFCTALKEGGAKEKCREAQKRLARHPMEGQQVIQMKINCGFPDGGTPASLYIIATGKSLCINVNDSRKSNETSEAVKMRLYISTLSNKP